MFKRLIQDWKGQSPEDLERAALGAAHLVLLALVVPGLVFGLIFRAIGGVGIPESSIWILLIIALVLSLMALWLARRTAEDDLIPKREAALAAAFQAGSSPAIPLLLGCMVLNQPTSALMFAGVSLVVYLVMRGWVLTWVRKVFKA